MRYPKILRNSFYLFFISLFFDRPELIYVFYIFSTIFFIVSLPVIIEKFNIIFTNRLLLGYLLFFLFSSLTLLWTHSFSLSSFMIFRLIVILILAFCSWLTFTYKGTKININIPLLIGLGINLILFIFPFIVPFDIFQKGSRFSGTFSNANALAIVGIFSIFFAGLSIIEKVKSAKIVYVIILVSLFLILNTGSRKGLIFGFLLIILIITNLKRNTIIPILITLTISLLLFINYISNNEGIMYTFERFKELLDFFKNNEDGDSSSRYRLFLIKKAYSIFLENPISGIGIDAFQVYVGKDLYAHNNYLELLADTGIIGFLLYYMNFMTLFLKSLKVKHKRNFIILFIFILILMDFTVVTYWFRFYWIALVFLYYKINKIIINDWYYKIHRMG